jgi:peptide/nickel transport system substrate-binding protein
MRHALIILLAFAVAGTLTRVISSSTISQGNQRSPRIERLWTIATPAKIETLDPQRMVSSYEKTFISLVFGHLVSLDENIQVTPELAETWEYENNSRIFTLHLRRGVTFSNGRDLTARDVVFSFHQWLRSESLDSDLLVDIVGSEDYRRGNSSSVHGIKVSDDYTVHIQLSHDFESFIRVLALHRFGILPADYLGQDRQAFFQHPVGSGPYLLESYDPQSVQYSANPNYFRGKPITEKIHVKYFQEDDAIAALNTHELVDLLMYDFTDLDRFHEPDLIAKKSGVFATVALYFVETDHRVATKGTRMALASKIIADDIITKCFPGAIRAGSFIPPGLVGSRPFESTLPRPIVDTPAIRGDIKILIPNDLKGKCFIDALGAQLANTGFHPEAVDWQHMFEVFKSGKMSIGIENFAFKTEDPLINVQYFHSTSNEHLLGKKIPELDRLFAKLNDNLTLTDKGRVYREIDSFLVNEYHVIPLLHSSRYTVYRKSLKNLKFAGWRVNLFNWHEIMIEEPQQ